MKQLEAHEGPTAVSEPHKCKLPPGSLARTEIAELVWTSIREMKRKGLGPWTGVDGVTLQPAPCFVISAIPHNTETSWYFVMYADKIGWQRFVSERNHVTLIQMAPDIL